MMPKRNNEKEPSSLPPHIDAVVESEMSSDDQEKIEELRGQILVLEKEIENTEKLLVEDREIGSDGKISLGEGGSHSFGDEMTHKLDEQLDRLKYLKDQVILTKYKYTSVYAEGIPLVGDMFTLPRG